MHEFDPLATQEIDNRKLLLAVSNQPEGKQDKEAEKTEKIDPWLLDALATLDEAPRMPTSEIERVLSGGNLDSKEGGPVTQIHKNEVFVQNYYSFICALEKVQRLDDLVTVFINYNFFKVDLSGQRTAIESGKLITEIRFIQKFVKRYYRNLAQKKSREEAVDDLMDHETIVQYVRSTSYLEIFHLPGQVSRPDEERQVFKNGDARNREPNIENKISFLHFVIAIMRNEAEKLVEKEKTATQITPAVQPKQRPLIQ